MLILLFPVLIGFPFVLVLAGALRLQLPLIYALVAPTLFRPWYLAHPVLAPGIFYALVALSVLSWIVSLVRFLQDTFVGSAEERAAAERYLCQVRQARVHGETVVSAEGR